MSEHEAQTLRGKSIGWWIKRLLAVAALALAVCLLILIALNYFGFCFRERRFLSAQERFRMVVERMVRNGGPFVPVKPIPPGRNYWSDQLGDKISHWTIKGHDGPVEPIYYRSADEFFARNPDCCEMRKYVSGSEGPFEPTFWDRALGDCAGGVVRITGTFRFRDQAGIEREIRYTGESLLNNCGMSLDVPF